MKSRLVTLKVTLISLLRAHWYWVLLVLVTALSATWWVSQGSTAAKDNGLGGKNGLGRDGRPVSVMVGEVTIGDIDIIQTALGTVNALNTVTVKPRVDGLLQKILFKEGQVVKAAEVLAEIDPRPFQIALEQAKGQLMRDQAQLSNAQIDLERYRGLQQKEAVSRQQVDTQAALVQQLEGVVKLDQAQVDNALLQLDFSRIRAPVTGRLGLRQVDVGNMVKSADTTGIVVLTQTQPVSVLFSLPSESLMSVLPRWLESQGKKGVPMKAETWSRDNKQRIADGQLLTVDNQVDTTTGTVRMKAVFENGDNALFPNQFVNVRLHVEKLAKVVLAPEAALQRGTQGAFVYVLNATEGNAPATVSMRKVEVGAAKEGVVMVQAGLKPGEKVVVDGLDKLRDGSKVSVSQPPDKSKAKGKPTIEKAAEQSRKKP